MTAAEELRAAAQRLRKLTAAVPPEPWKPGGIGDFGWTLELGDPAASPAQDRPGWDARVYTVIETEDSEDGKALVRYLAAMHPGVALALAAWLESAAEDAEQIGVDPHALEVARAIGGEPR